METIVSENAILNPVDGNVEVFARCPVVNYPS
jgi:hypothetical protein